MAITKERTVEVLVAEAHACGDEVHVCVADALTVEQSKALRKEMKAAEAEAESYVEDGNAHVNDVFGNLFAGLMNLHLRDEEKGEADA